MKNKIVKILLAALVISAPLLAHASVIWYDGFTYTNGSLAVTNVYGQSNNVSGGFWVRESGTAKPSDMYIVNSNLQVTATGGSVISRQDDCMRYFGTTNGTTSANLLATYANTNYDGPQLLYASFTVICTTAISNGAALPNGTGSYFASFYSNTNYGSIGGLAGTNADGYGYCGRVQAFTNGTILPNTWRLGVTDNTLSTNLNNGGFPVDLAVNTAYQVVEEIDPFNLQACTIWVNPTDPNQTGSSPTEPHYTANDSMGKMLIYGVNGYAFRQPSSFGNAAFAITNLAIATTFADAMTNVLGTNAFPPTIVYQPVAITNFIASSVSLSAVANGQGLASLTYQWQISPTPDNASPMNVSGGNANVLSINTSSAITNYYTLIVTTPYGLSTTSAVTPVAISAGTNPPKFTSQPVNQTIYSGQTAAFSATVITPGTPSFTWYSNNVVVSSSSSPSSAQVDNGDTSTYTLVNATTNFAALYNVAVTNSVNVVGIVSTNATLTILQAPQVTIAYLRTLVDPTTYQPTNSSLPYQITGTITTFTNTTSGNTASYFLQDGTAGINIFATVASTFRPQQGDVVTFVGVLSYFSTTGLELYADPTGTYPFTSYVDTGTTNALPVPIIIPFSITNNLGFINTNLGGSLVTITNVYFGASAGTTISTSANQSVNVTNASGQTFAVQFFDLDLDTAGKTLPTFATSVTGVLFGGTPSFSVAVTRFSDIVTNLAVVSSIPLSLNYSGGNLTFTWSDSSFSLQSSTNVLGPYTTITGANSGFMTNTTGTPTMFFRLSHP